MATCIGAVIFVKIENILVIAPKCVLLIRKNITIGMELFVPAVIRLEVPARSVTLPLPTDLPEEMKLVTRLSH
jgi:hypothetical protein